MPKIIVLGCSGFIGTNICERLSSSGATVLGVDNIAPDHSGSTLHAFIQSGITDDILRKMLGENEVSIIINAAGRASVYESFSDPVGDFTSNTGVNHLILDAIRKYSSGTRFLFFSSAAVYGNPSKLPVAETDALHPISPYGFHKLQSEITAREYAECFGINSIALRIFSCYGDRQRKLLLWDLCNKARAQKQIVLKGCGNESRDFIHVLDVAACVEHLVKKDSSGFEVYNLASGVEYSIRDVATLLVNKLGTGNEISFEGEKNLGNPDNWVADISKLLKSGYRPSVPFEKGIEMYSDWFKSL